MLTATPIRAPVRTRTLPGGLPALALAATLLSGLGLPRPARADDAVPSGLTVQFPAALTDRHRFAPCAPPSTGH